MSRMETNRESARVSIRVNREKKEKFKGICDAKDTSMSEVLNERIEEVIETENAEIADSNEYYPDDPELRELYQTCLHVAENANYGPTIYQRRHGSKIAQETQQLTKSNLPDALKPLRELGYVALGVLPPSLQGDNLKRWRNWIIKPPEADPKQWKYREGH